MQPLVFGELKIDVTRPPGMFRLDWRGRSNHRQPETAILPFLAEIAVLAERSESIVEMHFDGLEFFNSSTIAAIIQYVKDLRERKVRLVFVFDPRHKWQKIFFDALWIFEKEDGLFRIQPIVPPANPPR